MNNGTSLETHKGIVRRCMEEVWTAGKVDLIPDFVHANFYLHHERNRDRDVAGINGVTAWVVTSRKAIPDLALTPVIVLAQDDRVMAYVEGRGTHAGSLKGTAATDAALAFTVTAMIRLAETKIAECWLIADTLGILQQVGAVRWPADNG